MWLNERLYGSTAKDHEDNIRYDSGRTKRMIYYVENLVEYREQITRAQVNTEKILINKEIKKRIKALDERDYE